MIYTWAVATNPGLVRTANEDAVHPDSDGSGPGAIIVAVADGMGGHAAGEVASTLALRAALAQQDATPTDRVAAANAAVLAAGLQRRDLAGMGTTLTLGMFGEAGELRVGHVGDSRAYLLRGGELIQLTRDHSVVAELVESGQLSPEDAESHPRRHVLTRALGTDWRVLVDEIGEQLHTGDRVLLCSDGLTNMVSDDAILDILGAQDSPQEAAWALVEAANAAGGEDNITAAVVDVRE